MEFSRSRSLPELRSSVAARFTLWVSPATEPVQRSKRRRRWHPGLVNKGLAAFQPVSVTLSLAWLRCFPGQLTAKRHPQSGRCATVFLTGVQNHCAQQANGGGRQQKSMAGHLDWRMRGAVVLSSAPKQKGLQRKTFCAAMSCSIAWGWPCTRCCAPA
jgi:hypothetical protein